MKKICLAAVAALLYFTASAQKEIPLAELNQHVGDSVTVCTKIYGGIYLEKSKLTLLNAGDAYPNAPLTIVIWQEAREKLRNKPEEFYKDKEVCITGKIVLYKEKPQIVLYDDKQITVKEK